MTDLVARAKASESLSSADIQCLLAFIAAPKPGDLTDGEWGERVNGILNLLRRQTQDGKTQDPRRKRRWGFPIGFFRRTRCHQRAYGCTRCHQRAYACGGRRR